MAKRKRLKTYPKGYFMRGLTLRMIVALIDAAEGTLDGSPMNDRRTREPLRRRNLVDDDGMLTHFGHTMLPAVVAEYARAGKR